MKTFEERFTAWVDGQLSGPALAAFEQELAQHPEAIGEREAALKLRTLLRAHADPPPLTNEDFFSLQLLQRIAAERAPVRPAAGGGGFSWPWSFPRLVLAGAACLAIAGACYLTLIPKHSPITPSDYFAQVVEAWPADPTISATTVYSPEDNVTVLWLEGLDYLPGDQLAIQ